MADSKISALPASTTPLAGTEVLPIVQSSTTKQVSVANLTAGRDIAATSLTTAAVQATNSSGLALKNSGGTTQLSLGAGSGNNITLSVATSISDNIIQGTAAKGINFTANTPTAGMTSQLLNSYEQGTWTPRVADAFTAGNSNTSNSAGWYTKIGNQVTIYGRFDPIVTTGFTATNPLYITDLPFQSANALGVNPGYTNVDNITFVGGTPTPYLTANTTYFRLRSNVSGPAGTQLLVSSITSGSSWIYFVITYQV
jgi:hypothetical protein